MVSVREPNADGLVYEEDVGLLIPGVWVEGGVVGIRDPTRSCMMQVVSVRKGSLYRQVPSSMKRPRDDEHPGPPLVQKMTSSLAGLFLLSKK